MRTYGRPPSDPLFLSRPRAEWEQEVLEEMLVKRDGLNADLEAANKTNSGYSGSQINAMLDQLNSISDIFGEPRTILDAVTESWERDLEAGRTPDFSRR